MHRDRQKGREETFYTWCFKRALWHWPNLQHCGGLNWTHTFGLKTQSIMRMFWSESEIACLSLRGNVQHHHEYIFWVWHCVAQFSLFFYALTRQLVACNHCTHTSSGPKRALASPGLLLMCSGNCCLVHCSAVSSIRSLVLKGNNSFDSKLLFGGTSIA